MRRTKIVITLGPSTDQGNALENSILSGANVLRLNFSHGTQAEHESRAYHAHRIIKKIGYNVALLGDLQGPKIRISKFKNNYVFLTKGNIFILDLELDSHAGNEIAVGINYKNIVNDLREKDILLLDDGKIKLKVIKIKNSHIITQVIVGGKLSNNKGINKLGGGLSADALTKKDKKDIIIASNIGVNYLAVSFPKCPEDLILARKLAKESGSLAKIIAKIERAEIIENLNLMKKIILATDIVMVARGDLGIEIGDTKLIDVQKQIIKYSRQLNRIVITATQMMESMIYNPYPTRAEVMDVANAVLDGTDAVMLSAETATGKYPSETVHKMSDICKGAEKVPSINISKHRLDVQFDNIEEAIAMSAMYAANHLKNTRAIVTITESGQSALLTSRINSGLPIFALSKHKNILNLLTLYRGVYPMYFHSQKKGLGISHDAVLLLLRHRLVLKDDIIIITQGDIMGHPGQANTHRILKIL